MTKPVYIIASSGHAKVIIDIFEKNDSYEVVGIVDGSRPRASEFYGYEVLGSREDLAKILSARPGELFVAIGDNWLRQRVIFDVLQKVEDPIFAQAIHPSAQVGRGVTLGQGCAVMAGAVINVDTKLSAFSIVNTQASVDHECVLGDFASVGPGAILGGNVAIGEYTAVAMGAMVKHGVQVGAHCVIGAGALLLEDCGDQRVLFGSPARDVRGRDIGEAYL